VNNVEDVQDVKVVHAMNTTSTANIADTADRAGAAGTAGDDLDLEEIRSAVRTVLEREAPSARVRALLDEPAGYDPALWQTAVALGWPGLHIPTRYGGLGLPLAALAVVLQEFGRHLVPAPFFASALLASGALLAADNDALKAVWLPRFAAGTARGALVLTGASGALHDLGLTCQKVGADWRIDGTAAFALDAHTADLLLLCARHADGGRSLFAVPAGTPGVRVVPTPGVDQTRRLCAVQVDAVVLDAGAALVAPGSAAALIDHVVDLGALGLACDALGGGERVLQMITTYAGERVQFGRAIGSFQAVKHKCADLLLLVEGMRVAVEHAAAACVLGGSGMQEAIAIAKAYAGEAGVKIAGDAMQLHGGIGFTWDHDMHLYLKRACLNQQMFGASAWQRERLACLWFDHPAGAASGASAIDRATAA